MSSFQNDWLFITQICNFLFYIAIAPFRGQDFRKTISIRRKCYVVLLIFLFTFFSMNQIWIRYTRSDKYIKKIGAIMDITSILTETVIYISVFLISNFFYSKNWQCLFIIINEQIEIYFKDKLPLEKSVKYYHIEFIFYTLLMIIMIFIDICSTVPMYNELFFVTTRINGFYQLFITLTMGNFIKFYSRRYNCLNNYLIQLIKRKEAYNRKDLINQINSATEMHRKMTETIEDLNKMFGLLIFLIMFFFLLKNVYWISIALHPERLLGRYNLLLFTFAIYFIVI